MNHRPVRLSLSAKSASHLAVFFSHNKSANSTFSHDLLAKRTGRMSRCPIHEVEGFVCVGALQLGWDLGGFDLFSMTYICLPVRWSRFDSNSIQPATALIPTTTAV
jgi:hypothetical protein